MNRAALLCVLLCLLGACRSSSSASSVETSLAPTSTTGDDHLACAGEDGTDIGKIPLPFLHVEDADIAAHYRDGYRESCPWLVEDDTVSTVMAIDGGTAGGVDVEVVTDAQLTVSVRRWSDDITVDGFHWIGMGGSGDEQRIAATEVEPGLWELDAPADPGEYRLSFQFHWEYGQDNWFWWIRVIN